MKEVLQIWERTNTIYDGAQRAHEGWARIRRIYRMASRAYLARWPAQAHQASVQPASAPATQARAAIKTSGDTI